MAQLNSQSITAKQAYLAAMGVKPWFARFVLPNAKPSPSYVIDEEDVFEGSPAQMSEAQAIQTRSQEVPEDSVDRSVERPRIREGLKLADSNENEQVAPTVQSVSPSLKDSAGELTERVPQQFHLNVYSIDGVLVVCECTDSSSISSEQSLIGGVLNAYFGRQYQPVLIGSFVWPVFSVMPPIQEGSEASVASTLEKFFDNSISDTFQHLFIFSAAYPIDALTKLASRAHSIEQVVTSTNTPSQCLNEPQLKRALWHDLVRQRAAI